MRKTWMVVILAVVFVAGRSSAARAEEKNPLGGLFRAISAILAPAANEEATAEDEAAPGAVIIEEEPTTKKAEADATHEQLKTVSVKGENGASLQTLTCTPDGKVVALVAPARHGTVVGKDAAGPISEVRVFDADGNQLSAWPLGFTAQSVAVSPSGIIYVGGDGKLAKFDAEGKSLGAAEVPHLTEVLKDQAKLKKQAEQQLKQEIESFESSKQEFQTQLDKLKEKEPADQTPTDKAQIRSLEANIRAYDQISKEYKNRSIQDVIAQLSSRLRIINGVTVTDKEVFIACGELKGHGYAIWRMSLDFENPKQVLSQIGGCCGQMDIQASGDDLFVAENTRHRVARYDRDGKLVKAFGKKSRESAGDCFGGCCNPMNCRIGKEGEVYTSESEGVVKKWSSEGKFLGTIGVAKLTGGCKNVAVAASPKGDRVYFCDLPGSKIIILAEKPKTPAAAAGN